MAQDQKPYWATAKQVKDITGWDKNRLRLLRQNNPHVYTINKNGGYLYNVNAIPELFKKSA